jgi:hypothetical protein
LNLFSPSTNFAAAAHCELRESLMVRLCCELLTTNPKVSGSFKVFQTP